MLSPSPEPLEEDRRPKGDDASLSSGAQSEKSESGDGQSNPDDRKSNPNDEESDSVCVHRPPQLKLDRNEVARASPHRSPNEAKSIFSSPPLKKLTRSGSKSKLRFLPLSPQSLGPRLPGFSNNKQAPAPSQAQTLVPTQLATPTELDPRPPLVTTSSFYSPAPSRKQPSPIDPPYPSQPENPIKTAPQTVEKNELPEKAAQSGPPDPDPDAVAADKGSSPSRVPEPELNQNETAVEPGNWPEGSPEKSPVHELPDKSDIESLYASPSPEKTATELQPIELDSDPDFEMLERMLFSHRGPSSQPQPIKKDSTTQPPGLSKTERPLKRQRGHPSLTEFPRMLTQTP